MWKEVDLFFLNLPFPELLADLPGLCRIFSLFQKSYRRASLMAQWLGIRLPMQGHGFEPWSRKIPHAAEQLSLCATITEPEL